MEENPSEFQNSGENSPVENVSWNDVQEFIKRLNRMEETDNYRLPTEAEWEYACRAGSKTRYYFGDDEESLKDYAWYDANADDHTHPVGQKKPNAWGLYDMHGNVWEWVQDRYGDYSSLDVADPKGASMGWGLRSTRVNRGGSWYSNLIECRSANRDSNSAGTYFDNLGFRLACSPGTLEGKSDDSEERKKEEAFWRTCIAADTLAAYQKYIKHYPQGEYTSEARAEIGRIEKEKAEDLKTEREAKEEEAPKLPSAENSFDEEVIPPLTIVTDKQGKQKAARNRIKNKFGMTFVFIPPGTFTMGSRAGIFLGESGRGDDETQHEVTISRPFYMQTTQVTQRQWAEVMGSNWSHFKDRGENCPVENVSWDDVQSFIRELNIMEKTNKYRLPTEAEWEYAARAGTQTRFHSGDSESDLSRVGWYYGNSGGNTHPVGQKQPNAWGLHDIHGNVWEWCQDWYDDYPLGHFTDPFGPPSGSVRVFRGGSWHSDAGVCRSAYRNFGDPGRCYSYLGFRLLRTY
jgi:formylglycine-generating enzyme required for sulfatase activity